MDLHDTPQEAAFRAEVRAWLDENVPKHLLPALEGASFGKSPFRGEEYLRHAREWQARKFDAGWACLHWPKKYGGREATPIQRIIWNQEEGPYRMLSGVFIIGHGMAAPTLMAYASEEQKRHYLPPMARGDEIWCQLFSEPSAGSDLAGIRTRSVREGDDWIVNGQKIWTSGAQHSKYGILVTRSEFDLPKHKGLTYFFIDMESPGVEVRPIKQVSGESQFNEVYFTNLRVPDAQRLGEVGAGWQVSLTTLMNERQAIGTSMAGGFAEILDYARRAPTGNGPAIRDAAVRDKLADFYVQSSGLRYTGLRSISAISQGRTPGPENSIGKVVTGQMLQEIASLGLELQDQAGLLVAEDEAAYDARFQFMLLRSLGVRIEGGTDEILKNIIAERVLGLPGDIRLDRDVSFKDIPSGW
ncbi:MAG TPA: acyl-CoA dehydrogenase family protein [Thermoanaerobaculia bacterium]|nr:acyl-CoA dehydrogenase family protein [Thermoanaerobaculia bacterium]